MKDRLPSEFTFRSNPESSLKQFYFYISWCRHKLFLYPPSPCNCLCTEPVSVYHLFKLTVKTYCKFVPEPKIRCLVVSSTHALQISKFKFSLLAKNHVIQFILEQEAVSETLSFPNSLITLYLVLQVSSVQNLDLFENYYV